MWNMPFQKGNQLAKGHNGGLRREGTVELVSQLNEMLKCKDGVDRTKLHRLVKNLITQATTGADVVDSLLCFIRTDDLTRTERSVAMPRLRQCRAHFHHHLGRPRSSDTPWPSGAGGLRHPWPLWRGTSAYMSSLAPPNSRSAPVSARAEHQLGCGAYHLSSQSGPALKKIKYSAIAGLPH